MYKIILIVCGLFLFSTAVPAQRFNGFVGYSYSSFGPNLPQGLPLAGSPGISSPGYSHRLNGWNSSLEAKVLSVLGIVADFSGHYGNETTDIFCSQYVFSCTPNNTNVSFYTFTVSPQVSMRFGRIEPYAHALVGGALSRAQTFIKSDISFADVLGGGVNFLVIRWLAWRVQADALQARFSFIPPGSLSSSSLPNKQNSPRLSTGVVFRF